MLTVNNQRAHYSRMYLDQSRMLLDQSRGPGPEKHRSMCLDKSRTHQDQSRTRETSIPSFDPYSLSNVLRRPWHYPMPKALCAKHVPSPVQNAPGPLQNPPGPVQDQRKTETCAQTSPERT